MTLARRFVSQIFCAAAMAGALAFGSASSLSAQEVTLKMHQFLPATANAPKLVLDVWADRVEKDSGGRIKVDHYPSMQLGGRPPELVDQVVNGVADIHLDGGGLYPGTFSINRGV